MIFPRRSSLNMHEYLWHKDTVVMRSVRFDFTNENRRTKSLILEILFTSIFSVTLSHHVACKYFLSYALTLHSLAVMSSPSEIPRGDLLYLTLSHMQYQMQSRVTYLWLRLTTGERSGAYDFLDVLCEHEVKPILAEFTYLIMF